MRQFDPIAPEETVTLTLDFKADLEAGETLSGTPTVALSVISGTDASVATRISGAPTISGKYVLQMVTTCQAFVTYSVTASCLTSTGRTLAVGGKLDCLPAYLQ